MFRNKRLWLIITLLSVVALSIFALLNSTQVYVTPHQSFQFVQNQNPQPTVPVLQPDTLGRISWGAVIAGGILALMIQLALNLLGLAIGTTQLDPYDRDAPSAKTLTSTAAFWLGLSTIISLIVGGWAAARFAGIPDNLDGMLHGLMVWGLVTLVTILLVSSTVGRLLSGVNFLLQRSLDLVGQATGTLVQGAATVAQGGAKVAQGGAKVVQAAAGKAAQATQDAVSSGADTVRQQINEHPEVRQALRQETTTRWGIEQEARKLLADAGIPQEQVEAQVSAAKDNMRSAAQDAAQQAQQGDLQQAAQTLAAALGNVLDSGREATQTVDRENLVNLLTSRTQMSHDQAEQAVNRWQNQYQKVRQQTDQARQKVGGQADQVQQKAAQVQEMVQDKIETVKEDAAETARQAADEARKSLGKVALALFAALVVGAIAAGIGGVLGTPHDLPAATVNTTMYIAPNG